MPKNGFRRFLTAAALLGGTLSWFVGCSPEQAADDASVRTTASAADVEGPQSLPPTDGDLMMQVGPESLPPEPTADATTLAVPEGEAPPMLTTHSFDAPKTLQAPSEEARPGISASRIAPQSMDATASPSLAQKIQRHSKSAEPIGGSAGSFSAQAYSVAPPAGDVPMAPQSSAMARMAPAPEAMIAPSPVPQAGLAPMDAVELPNAAANPAIETRSDGSKWVKIFYATDRSADRIALVDSESASASEPSPWRQHLPVLFCIGGTILAVGFAFLFSYRKTGVGMLVCGAGIAAAVFASQGTRLGWFAPAPVRAVEFGAGRDSLRFGVCQISLPPGHERGTMESPSLLHLEWHPDPKKHVALLETIELDREECLTRLREDLAASPKSEVFVFIHGYNVTFEDAARRTGQLAHDLDFPGPAMLYSWPSQGTTAGYPVDENNVAWTVPHLKDVLQTLQHDTGATAVHVVAHSMGNRALTAAVRELALEGKLKDTPLGQIVLAAPDVDAEVFRRDLLPAMQASAQRVTLYASSYDRALLLSKTIHGYPRAGESGEGLVVAPGLETIDVSGADLTLLGHSYYGDVARVVEDLKTLIFENKAAAARPYLVAKDRQGVAYWQVVMQPVATGPGGPPSR